MMVANLLLTAMTGLVTLGIVLCSPCTPVESPGYTRGDRIDPDTWVVDSELNRLRLVELFDSSSRVIVLVFFGGRALHIPTDSPFRGPLWCQDSFDDLAVQRALVAQFAGEPVQFIGIAVPPVYGPVRYGYPEHTFLDQPEDSPAFREAAAAFVRGTGELYPSGLIPFKTVYYDPAFRLLANPKIRSAGPGSGPPPAWQGRFRWRKDTRRYGVPVIWLLNGKGQVLAEPFWGNEYAAQPPHVNYGFAELKHAIDQALEPK